MAEPSKSRAPDDTPSSAAAFRRKRRQCSEGGFAAGEEALTECRGAWEQGSETPLLSANRDIAAERLKPDLGTAVTFPMLQHLARAFRHPG